jgi:hypothetical protein
MIIKKQAFMDPLPFALEKTKGLKQEYFMRRERRERLDEMHAAASCVSRCSPIIYSIAICSPAARNSISLLPSDQTLACN